MVVKVLSHGTHCSQHDLYESESIMDCLVKSTNGLTFFVYYPNQAMATNVYFWRPEANFWNIDLWTIIIVKTLNDFIFPLAKGYHRHSWVWKNGNIFLIEGIMGWILVLTIWFIPKNSKKYFMKYQNNSIINPLQLRVGHDPCFIEKLIIDKHLHLIMFCLYIVKGWRDTI